MAQLGPDSVNQIYEALQAAQSPQPEVQKAAEAALRELEPQTGFCSCLAEVVRNKQADHSARWLASIMLKNTVARHWKPRAGQGGISEGEKQHLRQTLLQLVDQENSQIAVPIAVTFAKVARADFPRAWPALFQDLMALMGRPQPLAVRRGYLVLHHILKELASMRLPADRRNFAEVTQLLFEAYWKQWVGDTQALLQGLAAALSQPQQASPLTGVFERWFLLLKGIRRMAVFSQPTDAKTLTPVPMVSQVVPAFLEALRTLHGLRPAGHGARTQLQAMLDRALIKLSDCLLSLLDVHPWSLLHSGAFRGCLEFFAGVVSQPAAPTPAYESYLRRAMRFLHEATSSKAYRGVPDAMQPREVTEALAGRVKPMTEAVQRELEAFWQTAGHARALLQAIMQLYLPLTAKELQDWAEDSEEFSQAAGTGAWEESLRGCSEVLFTTVLGTKRDALAGVVLEQLRAAAEACPPGAAAQLPGERLEGVPRAVLAKEAAYAAVGVAAWELLDHVDFGSWLHSSLLPEIGDRSREGRPLRRRAGVLIGQWVSKLKPADRPAAYRVLLSLLEDDDFATALAGVGALHELVSDWDFQEEAFLPFVAPALQLSAALLHAAELYDSQRQVFNLVNLLFDRLADSVKPFLGTIMQLLPDLWRESEDQSLLRIQILLSLQRIVNALGRESPTALPLVLPTLQACTDPRQRDQLNLLEDGLQLWLVALRNAPEPHPQLLALFPHLVAAMEQSTEHVPVAARILASCALLGGRAFLASHGAAFAGLLAALLGQLKEKGALLLLPAMDVAIQIAPAEGAPLLEPALRALLAQISASPDHTTFVTGALRVFARVLLHSPAFFVAFFQAAPPAGGQPALAGLLEAWLDRFDSLASPGARKLVAMALLSLLRVPAPWLLERLPEILGPVTATWFELEHSACADQELALGFTGLYQPFEAGGDTSSSAVVLSEEADGESSRRQQLHEQDPVARTRLSAFLNEELRAAAAAHGSQAFDAAMGRADPTLVAQLQLALSHSQQPRGA